MVYSTRRFVVCLSVCHFVLVVFSPFSIAITSLGEERANLSAFCTFVRFVLVWICRFPLPLGVWEGLRFVIVALPGLFSYLFLGRVVLDRLFYGPSCPGPTSLGRVVLNQIILIHRKSLVHFKYFSFNSILFEFVYEPLQMSYRTVGEIRGGRD